MLPLVYSFKNIFPHSKKKTKQWQGVVDNEAHRYFPAHAFATLADGFRRVVRDFVARESRSRRRVAQRAAAAGDAAHSGKEERGADHNDTIEEEFAAAAPSAVRFSEADIVSEALLRASGGSEKEEKEHLAPRRSICFVAVAEPPYAEGAGDVVWLRQSNLF